MVKKLKYSIIITIVSFFLIFFSFTSEITYGLAQKLGGNITVESKVGEGTIFTVRLPINDTRKEGNFNE